MQLFPLDCSTLPLINTLYCWVLIKEVSSTIFKVFGMTWPGIEPRSPGPLVNTLPLKQWAKLVLIGVVYTNCAVDNLLLGINKLPPFWEHLADYEVLHRSLQSAELNSIEHEQALSKFIFQSYSTNTIQF